MTVNRSLLLEGRTQITGQFWRFLTVVNYNYSYSLPLYWQPFLTGPSRWAPSHISPKDGNRPSSRNSSCLFLRFGNKIVRKIFRLKKGEVSGLFRMLYNEKLWTNCTFGLYPSSGVSKKLRNKSIYAKKSQYTRPKFTQGSITNHRATYLGAHTT
jgi:hypothetical protein